MIIPNMRLYDYYKTTTNAAYGQEVMPPNDAVPEGKVKLSIYPTSTGTQENILYANCSYVAYTYDGEIDDKYIIQYGKERLKVMYKQHIGHFKLVYLARVN